MWFFCLGALYKMWGTHVSNYSYELIKGRKYIGMLSFCFCFLSFSLEFSPWQRGVILLWITNLERTFYFIYSTSKTRKVSIKIIPDMHRKKCEVLPEGLFLLVNVTCALLVCSFNSVVSGKEELSSCTE